MEPTVDETESFDLGDGFGPLIVKPLFSSQDSSKVNFLLQGKTGKGYGDAVVFKAEEQFNDLNDEASVKKKLEARKKDIETKLKASRPPKTRNPEARKKALDKREALRKELERINEQLSIA
jgi:hypothetical protein